MAVCPRCGNEATVPVKAWPLPLRNPICYNQASEIVVRVFECPKCKARFRSPVGNEMEVEMRTSIKGMVERIKGIHGELMYTLTNLREKIKNLETERSSLMTEIENLKKVAESRANALESEVGTLKEELESLRELIGRSGETKE